MVKKGKFADKYHNHVFRKAGTDRSATVQGV